MSAEIGITYHCIECGGQNLIDLGEQSMLRKGERITWHEYHCGDCGHVDHERDERVVDHRKDAGTDEGEGEP